METPSTSSVPPTPTTSTAAVTSDPTAPAVAVVVEKVANPLDALTQPELRKKLDASRQDLKKALDKKKRIDKDLALLENSIFAFEGSYLSDSLLPASSAAGNANAQFGNIIRGYDSYLKAPPTGSDRKRGRGVEEARDSDRIFSRSSATYLKAVELRTNEIAESGGSEEESSGVGSTANRKRRKN